MKTIIAIIFFLTFLADCNAQDKLNDTTQITIKVNVIKPKLVIEPCKMEEAIVVEFKLNILLKKRFLGIPFME